MALDESPLQFLYTCIETVLKQQPAGNVEGQMTPTPVFPKGKQAAYDRYGYSAAIKSGDLLFVSGQVGVDENGAAIAEPAAQIEQAFANMRLVLDAAGCSTDDIVDVTSFHVDMHRHFEAFRAMKKKAFPAAPFPNWTAVGVTTLADPSLIFEIKVVARVPKAAKS
jgi:enamine deaminase RidA (YjgF/YER057c/UK114 family)